MIRSSYQKEDVTLLLKDITGLVEPESTQDRERQIQQGRHYCEMLPIEYQPSPTYAQTYAQILSLYAKPTASAIGALADKIMAQRGERVVLVSLARAGIPIGILLKRYLRHKYGITVPHYAISIIRGRGIDHNAMNHLLSHHQPEQLLFVDGWIGKGAILTELEKAVAAYPGVSSELAVVADPANMTQLCGTHEDLLIPSSCLNATVSGLVSRTFLRPDIIAATDFHGAVYYGELSEVDQSQDFLETIQSAFTLDAPAPTPLATGTGIDEVRQIANAFDMADINLIKPGIGETTRVLLRRVPWKILMRQDCQGSPALAPIIRLAQEKNVPIVYYPLTHYQACGLIRKLADT